MRIIFIVVCIFLNSVKLFSQQFADSQPATAFPFSFVTYDDSLKAVKHTGFFDALNQFYKTFLSDQLVSACEFDPSCSAFSRQAIRQFGPVKGIFLTADRLTRCNGNASAEIPESFTNPDNAKIFDKPEYYRFSTLKQKMKSNDSLPLQTRGKSAVLAAGLSAVLPGSGKFYLHAPYQATSSMVTNVLLGGAAAEILLKSNDPYLTVAAIALFSTFYIGNIWGTVALAKKQKQDPYRENQFLQQRKKEMIIPKPVISAPETLTEKYEVILQSFNKKDYSRAYRILLELPDSMKYNDHQLLSVWLQSMAAMGFWEECRDNMLSMTDSTKSIYNDIKELPIDVQEKSPSKAYNLSALFPGSGQVYARNGKKGIISLLLQSASIAITVAAATNELYLTGVVFGIYPFLRFYSGGKLNARMMAQQYNTNKENDLKNRYLVLIQKMMAEKM